MATRADDTWTLDLSDPETKCTLVADIMKAEGVHEVMIHKKKGGTSNPQHAYYRGVVIPWFQKGAMAEWGYDPGPERSHNMLKAEHLRVHPPSDENGVVRGMPEVRSTADLEWDEMGQYIELCCGTILDYFGLTVPEADKLWKIRDQMAEGETTAA